MFYLREPIFWLAISVLTNYFLYGTVSLDSFGRIPYCIAAGLINKRKKALFCYTGWRKCHDGVEILNTN